MGNDYTCIKLKGKIPFSIEMFHSLLIFAKYVFSDSKSTTKQLIFSF